MIQEKIKNHTAYCIGKIDSSKIEDSDKLFLRELVENCCEGTNGLDNTAKLQKCSENIFYLSTMLVMDKCKTEQNKLTGLYRLLYGTRWQITIISAIVAVLLIFQPQIAQIIMTFFK